MRQVMRIAVQPLAKHASRGNVVSHVSEVLYGTRSRKAWYGSAERQSVHVGSLPGQECFFIQVTRRVVV